LLLCLLFPLFPAHGQVDIAGAEIDALVLDRTLTRIGHDFFREFVARLGAEEGIPGVSLTIREKVSAQWGGVITVEANDQVIYTAPLRPKSGGIAEIVEQAAGATADFLVRASGTELRPDDEDLAEDGL
jgi:curli production assembly/transport component CsgE